MIGTPLHQLSSVLLRFRAEFCPVRQHRIGCGPAASCRLVPLLTILFCILGCQKPVGAPPAPATEDSPVTKLGSIEVAARLVEVPDGAIFKRDLYDYATILKFEVLTTHRGQTHAGTIFVGQYNPFKPRDQAADRRVKGIGGNAKSFAAGRIYRMALESPLDDHFMGGIVNKYFGQDTGPLYWAVWTDAAD